jgi:hypothetical protein
MARQLWRIIPVCQPVIRATMASSLNEAKIFLIGDWIFRDPKLGQFDRLHRLAYEKRTSRNNNLFYVVRNCHLTSSLTQPNLQSVIPGINFPEVPKASSRGKIYRIIR